MFKKLLASTILFAAANTAFAGAVYNAEVIDSNLRDIRSTGTQINLGDDHVSGYLNIGFGFDFYEVEQTQTRVSSNGFLTFNPSTDSGCCSGDPIPSPGSPNALFAGLWEDLDSNNNTSGTMYYQTLGEVGSREFVVGFYNVAHWPNNDPVTFEMILHEGSNDLEVQFGALNNNGTHTIGIENYNGTEGVEFYRGSNIEQFNNTGVLFTANVMEPQTAMIFGLGLFGLFMARRKA